MKRLFSAAVVTGLSCLVVLLLLIPSSARAATPVISAIANQSTLADTNTYPIPFTISDPDSNVDDLTISAETMNAVNDAPTIGNVGDQTLESTDATPQLGFTVSDVETAAADLMVSAESSNTSVIANGNIALGGSGENRTVAVTAGTTLGSTTITLTVDDGTEQTTSDFEVSVVNSPPTISAVANQSITINSSTGALAFTVGDAETAAADLIVSAESSNTAVIPNGNIALGGSDANRTVNVTAGAATGTATITLTVDDGTDQTPTTFDVTVTNTAPTISTIAPQTIDEDSDTGALPFTVGDAETAAADLIVSAESSNTALVPNANLALGGSDANRTITATPVANASGTTTITLTVDDGLTTNSSTFLLTVTALNDPPTITPIGDTTIDQDTSTGPLAFTIDDIDSPMGVLSVSAESDNQLLAPNGNLTLGGTDPNRTINVTPAAGQSGTATITVRVNDGSVSAETSFLLTVNAVNATPTISPIENQTTPEDTPTSPIAFTVGDAETAAVDLVVTATSSDPTLLPNANISLGGTDANRTITLSPAANQHGTTTITITVSDGDASAEETFDLIVTPVNDAPQLDLNGGNGGNNYATSYATNGNPVTITGSGLTLSDIDSSTIASATITIVNLKNTGAETLSAVTDGTSIGATYNEPTLTLTGVDTIANYVKVLKSITYRNTSQSPNLADRQIQITVNDGQTNSNTAQSTVAIQHPLISIKITPVSQTVGRGGDAIFVVEVKNDGNVNLTNVNVLSPQAPDCKNQLNFSSLQAGSKRSYSCSIKDILVETTVTVSVEAKDVNNRTLSDSSQARVEVENPGIKIVKSPTRQVVREGATAEFTVFVVNTSTLVDLVNVEISDPLAPDCNRQGNWEHANLASGEDFTYTCEAPNVTAAFTNEITVTGENVQTGQEVSDSNTARVELLDLTATLSPNPTSIAEPGGSIDFELTITNSGSVPLALSDLTSDDFGSLTDPSNSALTNNTCDNQALPTLKQTGDTFTCSFTAEISAEPPVAIVTVTVDAQDEDGTLPISEEVSAEITIIPTPRLQLSVIAAPSNLGAPGGTVTFQLSLKNASQSESIEVDTLAEATLGSLDGVGTCRLPLSLDPQSTYECQYQRDVFGSIGDVVTFEYSAEGLASSGRAVETETSIGVNIVNPNLSLLMLPMIANDFPAVEPNNRPCSAYGIATGNAYQFMPDDRNDWYYFDVDETATVTVELRGLVVSDSQFSVWDGTCTDLLTPSLGYDGAVDHPNKTIQIKNLKPGQYFIWVLNGDNIAYSTPYSLRVVVSK